MQAFNKALIQGNYALGRVEEKWHAADYSGKSLGSAGGRPKTSTIP